MVRVLGYVEYSTTVDITITHVAQLSAGGVAGWTKVRESRNRKHANNKASPTNMGP